MSSSRASSETDPQPRAASTALGFDPDAMLLREPGVLLDPRFLSTLRRELEQQVGGEETSRTLLQIGFLHGLRDASRIVDEGLMGPGGAGMGAASPLPIRFRSRSDQPGTLELHGCWPERSEATAWLSRREVASEASCWLSAGYSSGWLSGILNADVVALETTCCTTGADSCSFVAREAEVWRRRGEAHALAALDALPFEALRALIAARSAETPPAVDPGAHGEEPVVHIWGPVMVIPFGGLDEGLMALELIGRDPEAAEVSVVVIDLGGAVVDEVFGTVVLERMVESIEAWGAEALFAAVSPLSERAVAELERQPLMVCKDTQEAIATAFRIAESQRISL